MEPTEALVQSLAGLLMAVATLAIAWITKKTSEVLNEKVDEKKRAFIVPMFQVAIDYAYKQLANQAKIKAMVSNAQMSMDPSMFASNDLEMEARRTAPPAVVASIAADYMLSHGPDALKHLGVNNRDSVMKMIEARL